MIFFFFFAETGLFRTKIGRNKYNMGGIIEEIFKYLSMIIVEITHACANETYMQSK